MSGRVDRDNLNEVMEFDHVIRVHADGTVTDEKGVYAPSLYATEDDPRHPEIDGRGEWELLNGFSGQHGYPGPIMHNSEFIGGGLADYILANPGVYVALVCYWPEVPEDEDNIEGWAIARLKET